MRRERPRVNEYTLAQESGWDLLFSSFWFESQQSALLALIVFPACIIGISEWGMNKRIGMHAQKNASRSKDCWRTHSFIR